MNTNCWTVPEVVRRASELRGQVVRVRGVFMWVWSADGLCCLTEARVRSPGAADRVDIDEPRLQRALELQVMCQNVGGSPVYWTEAEMEGALSIDGDQVKLTEIRGGVIHCDVDGESYPFAL